MFVVRWLHCSGIISKEATKMNTLPFIIGLWTLNGMFNCFLLGLLDRFNESSTHTSTDNSTVESLVLAFIIAPLCTLTLICLFIEVIYRVFPFKFNLFLWLYSLGKGKRK